MATMARTYSGGSRFPLIWVILAVAVAAGLALGTHANKHTLADVVRNCPQDNIGLKLLNPITGYTVIICEYEPGQWGRIVTDGDHEVTAYADSHSTINNTLDRVIGTLYRGGYRNIVQIKNELIPRVAEILGALR